jgi:myo-inositol-1(or 4)-monophosphatase
MDVDERFAAARAAARRGGQVAHERFRTDLDVDRKDSKTDLVTDADRDAQAAVVTAIAERYPDEPVVGEEDDAPTAVPDEGPVWIVDPIDGTNNYVRGVRTWATSIAVVVDGEPVAAATVLPALGDIYCYGPDGATRNGEPISVSDRTDPETFTVATTVWWPFDRREEYAAATRETVERFGDLARYGCAQATLGHVAVGGLDGAFTNVDTHPWDTVAGAALVEAAGGTVTDLDGDRWTHASQGLVASNGTRHEELLAAARATHARSEA